MNHGSALPRQPLNTRKAVPPGSDLYEQVLDDLRHDIVQSPSSLLSPSSSSQGYRVTAQAEFTEPGGEFFTDQHCPEGEEGFVLGDSRCECGGGAVSYGGGGGGGDWFRTCSVCFGSVAGGWTEVEDGGWMNKECLCCDGGADPSSSPSTSSSSSSAAACIHQVCQLVGRDLPRLQGGETPRLQCGNMGHSSSLLLHKRHKQDYLAPEGNHNHTHNHNHSHSHNHGQSAPAPRGGPASPSKRRSSLPASVHSDKGKPAATNSGGHPNDDKTSAGHAGRSLSLPRAVPGHAVSWSASSGCQGRSKFFTNSDDPDDTGSPSSRPHPPLSRLYPRVPAHGERQSSLSPNRARKDTRGRPSGTGHSPTAARNGHRAEEEEVDQDSDYRQSGADRSLTPSPKRERLPDVHQAGNKVTGGRSLSASPKIPGRGDGTGAGAAGRCRQEAAAGGTPSSSSSMSFLPVPSAADRSTGCPHSPTTAHVRLCKFGVQDGDGDVKVIDVTDDEDNADDDDEDFGSVRSGPFRPRSMSDISMHVQRRRQLPRLPLLRQGRAVEEEEGQEGDEHAHVHWADEERGFPLATSVLLSSIRPRALSHGSATLPSKPILKKPFGF